MESILLSNLRKKRNLTQRQLAENLGFSSSAIAMYELGARIPSLERARKLAKYFNVSLDDILFSRQEEI